MLVSNINMFSSVQRYGISEKWDPRSETGDPSHSWDPGPETREPEAATRDPRPTTHLIGGTRYSKVGPETRDPRPGTLKVDFKKMFPVFSETWRL